MTPRTVVRRRNGATVGIDVQPPYVLPDLWGLCVPLADVDPDPANVNVHPASQIKDLRHTLKTYGQHRPLVVQPRDGRLVCRAGNGVLQAALAEGWEYIAVVRADADDDVTAMARAIRDNTASWGSDFDDEALAQQLREIDAANPDLVNNLGWDADDLERLLYDLPRDAPELPPLVEDGDDDDSDEWEDLFTTTPAPAAPAEEPAEEPSSESMSSNMTRTTSSESNEWYTPPSYVELARLVMGGIDLDPASCDIANETVGATDFFTKDDDGMSCDWHGRVWLNPPYGRTGRDSTAGLWCAYAVEQFYDGFIEQACILVNAATAQTWFRPLWEHAICFPYERIRYVDPDGIEQASPPHANAIIYLGDDYEKFAEVFSSVGRVVLPAGDVTSVSV